MNLTKEDIQKAIEVLEQIPDSQAKWLVVKLKRYERVVEAQSAAQAAYQEAYQTYDDSDWRTRTDQTSRDFWDRAAKAVIAYDRLYGGTS